MLGQGCYLLGRGRGGIERVLIEKGNGGIEHTHLTCAVRCSIELIVNNVLIYKNIL